MRKNLLYLLLVPLVGAGIFAAPAQAFKPQIAQVGGTRIAGHAYVYIRYRPTTHAEEAGRLNDGTYVGVLCKRRGGVVKVDYRGHHYRPRTWFKIGPASWVIGYFVYVGKGIHVPKCHHRG